MKLVSIIIPVYNSEKYLEKCLSSVLNQSYKNIEVILIDDGSSDNSLEIIKKYAKNDRRIKYKSQENKGQSHARNVGIKMSKGDFIVFVDSDDWLDETFISRMYSKMIKENADLIICNHRIHTPKKVREINNNIESHLSSEEAFRYMLNGKISHVCWAKMYKADIIKNCGYLFPEGKTNEDLFIVSVWMLTAKNIYILNECLYNVRHRSGSVTNSFSEKFIDLLDILDMLQEFLKEKGLYKNFEEDYRFKYQSLIIYLINYGIRFNSMSFVENVINNSKLNIKDFETRKFPLPRKIMVMILKISTSLYFHIMKIYYKLKRKKSMVV
jgi:glycosyltransferase involved in cell wall biosynthesis